MRSDASLLFAKNKGVNMFINAIAQPNPISFGYKSILKTLYKKGELPEVVKDIYGKVLTPETVTIEHIIPKSKKGASNLTNYALANARDNMSRSSDDLLKHTTVENIKEYFEQFIGVKRQGFDGDKYIKNAKKTLKKLDIEV